MRHRHAARSPHDQSPAEGTPISASSFGVGPRAPPRAVSVPEFDDQRSVRRVRPARSTTCGVRWPSRSTFAAPPEDADELSSLLSTPSFAGTGPRLRGARHARRSLPRRHAEPSAACACSVRRTAHPVQPSTAAMGPVSRRARSVGASTARARVRGWPVAAVRDWPFVVTGPYIRLAAEAGLIGLASRTSFGWSPRPVVGPRSSAPIPSRTGSRRKHHSMVLDIATTVSSIQKARLAAAQGRPIPEDLRSTTPAIRPPTPKRSS